MIIDGIRQMLDKYTEYQVVGHCLSGHQAVAESIKHENIDVFITDINLPDIDGLIVISNLKIHFPDAKFIVLSMHNNKNIVKSAFQRGIMGYVLKNAGEEDLIEAINSALIGKRYISQGAIGNLLEGLSDFELESEVALLTDREITIAKLTAKGMTSSEIGAILFISSRTVETHRRNIMHKLSLKNHSELIKYAIQVGWIDLDE